LGVKAAADDAEAIIAPAKTHDVITEAAAGGVYLTYGKYTVNVAEDLALEGGPEPAENHPVEAAGRGETAIGSYNVENLYDTRDNPNSECDDLDDPGCVDPDDPEGNVDPPFDYVPASYEEYETRMGRMASQITEDLHGPAVLMVQEAETQDVCEVNPEWTRDSDLGSDRLVCDLENTGEANAHTDGRPDSLQELALIIAENGGAEYTAAGDLDAGDTRGIMTGFLYRAEDVELLDAEAADPVLGSDPAVDYGTEADEVNADVQNPKALNAALPEDVLGQCTDSGVFACNGSDVFSRPAQVGLFRFTYEKPGRDKHADVYLINNHFSSGPDGRVLHRTEQAAYVAAMSAAILSEDRRASVLAAGDFNVFPRPDDPFAPGRTIAGDWVGPSDQLAAMYEDSGLTSLYDTMIEEHPEAAYSYTYMGQTQTLDQMWASPSLLRQIEETASAHINADYPADAPGEEPAYGAYGVSDHDPEVVTIDLKHLCK
ncbi:endonuclease/exonuclease/phosphatase family protein, partial [Glycomyces tenuis]|uniref:endonuclease/exonuclease/phosphatase family protein n=2 Tax=Glycomyces tenuis TaxID=58116 RepID=UPI001B807577